MIAVLLVLAVAALAIPTLATAPGAPDAGHAQELSVFTAVILLVLFAASIPFSIAGGPGASAIEAPVSEVWPLPLALGVLAAAATGAAFASDWFVAALSPALGSLGISRRSPASSSWRSPGTPSRTWSGSRWRCATRPTWRSA